mmetsp:Transcript_5012/g.7240  ORF Transcript_5012/g.7240 Transcript_5012/m.7240 type:complete len:834 (-) Transcript_5012:279-2780(-)
MKVTPSSTPMGDDSITGSISNGHKTINCLQSNAVAAEKAPSRKNSQSDSEMSGPTSKQPSPVATFPVQSAQAVSPCTIQQPSLQDARKTQPTPETRLSIKINNAPQVVKKGRFTVSQDVPLNISKQQAIDRTVAQTTQVQKGRFTVTLDSSTSAENESLPAKAALTSTKNVTANGIEHSNNNTSNLGISSGTVGAHSAQSTTAPAPQLIKKKGRFMVSSAESSTIRPSSQGSIDSNQTLQAQTEVFPIPIAVSTAHVHSENESLSTTATAVPQLSIETLSQSPPVQAASGISIAKVAALQGTVTGVQTTSDASFLTTTNSDDQNITTTPNATVAKPILAKRPTSGKPPASFDSKGVGSVVGLGKVLYYVEQMRTEVSEADQTLKAYQKEIKFLKERNKELEHKWRETEKRWKEEKINREASDSKVRNLKKKIKEMRDASELLQRQSEQVQPPNESEENENRIKSEKNGIRKSFSHGHISDEMKQMESQCHPKVSNDSNDATNNSKKHDDSPSQWNLRDLQQQQSYDGKVDIEKATTVALQCFKSRTNPVQVTHESTHMRHSSESVSTTSYGHDTSNSGHDEERTAIHKRHMSATTLSLNHFSKTNIHSNMEDTISLLNTGSCTSQSSIMSNGSTSIISNNISSIPIYGTQSINTGQHQQVPIITMQPQQQLQQQNMNGVQNNIINSQQIAAGQTQKNKQAQPMMAVNPTQQQQNHQQWNNQGQFHSSSVIQPAMVHSQQLGGQSMMGLVLNHGNSGTHQQQQDILSQGISSNQSFLLKQTASIQTTLPQPTTFQQTSHLQSGNGTKGQQQQFPAQQPQTSFTQQQQHTNRQWS